ATRSSPAAADPQPNPAAMLTDPTTLAVWLRTHDAAVASAGAKVEVALAARRQAGVLPNPRLDLSYGNIVLASGNPMRGSPGLGNTTAISAGVTEMIELGKRGPRQQAADMRVVAAREDVVVALGTRIGDAITAIGKVAYLVARHNTLVENL